MSKKRKKPQRRTRRRPESSPVPPPVVPPASTIDPSILSGKHQATLADIFANPVQADVNWRDIEAMLVALGTEVTEGNGSRVRCALGGLRAVFHRPHPKKETSKGVIRSVRRFLSEAGVRIP